MRAHMELKWGDDHVVPVWNRRRSQSRKWGKNEGNQIENGSQLDRCTNGKKWPENGLSRDFLGWI